MICQSCEEPPFVRKVQWYVGRLYNTLKRGKFRVVFNWLIDPELRADHARLCRLLGHGQELKPRTTQLALSSIDFSHRINYPKWVVQLEQALIEGINLNHADMYPEVIDILSPIAVIWLEDEQRYLVVDGNHRLRAMKNVLHRDQPVKVRILE